MKTREGLEGLESVDRVDRIPGAATVAAAQEGDQRAQDDLVAGYLPLVYNIVGRALHGHADVDDVVQETMLRMLEGIGGLRERHSFRSWLVAVAMNQVRSHWREKQRVVQGDGLHDAVDLADPAADFVNVTIARLGLSGQRQEVAEATRWLDENDRALLSLWWLEAAGELSRAEVAAAMELSVQHTAVRVQRMKSQLETARVVTRALSAEPRCGELGALVERWDGVPSALWRKRISRHARECLTCSGHSVDLVPAEGLLVGLGLVPPAVGLLAAWGAAGGHGTAAVATAAHVTSAGGGLGGTWGGATAQQSAAGLPTAGGWRSWGHRGLRGQWVGTTAVAAGVLCLVLAFPDGDDAPEGPPQARPHPSAPSATLSATPLPRPSHTASPRPSRTPSGKPVPTPSRSQPQASRPSRTGSAASRQEARGTSGAAQQVLAVINQARAAHQLPPYTLTSGLGRSAQDHSTKMANGCGLSHQCPGEAPFDDRERAQGVTPQAAGENIGDASSGPEPAQIASAAVGLTRAMLDEQPPNDYHRQNLLSGTFHHIGISVYRDARGMVWMTQDFSD
ncbi:hypothetical protein B1H19_33775 [Streptomyces gilvosporeus]|uniref:RNA polymerase n=1 Tax=Streptomyces gilvosporeus TaxID=553510 RepID=A0A1V0U472_9ACTN|nr:hypothetical protein B1H19_33775 [Streptomyces gilvosporeus]